MQTESIQSLAHRIREAKKDGQSRFVLFLGAGASQSSGIPVAGSLVLDIQRKLREVWTTEGSTLEFDAWLLEKPGWKNNQSDYAKNLEAYEPTESGRQRYLNKWMVGASPAWGYFCLAQLLARSYVETIVTTNFDDLVYDSSSQYSTMRPRVYSRLTPSPLSEHQHGRTTIIKLHGDYLYWESKNTTDELRQLDTNLMSYVSGLFQSHDIIVVGYGGNDARIMDDLFANVPTSNAVYWCTLKGSLVPEQVRNLVEADVEADVEPDVEPDHKSHWFNVRIDGFDEFMDELVHQLDFTFSSIMRPIQNLIDAIPGRIEGSQSRYIDAYLADAKKQLEAEEAKWARIQGSDKPLPTPLRLRLDALAARRRREYQDAIRIYESLVQLPNQATCEVLIEYAVTLELTDKYDEAIVQLENIQRELIEDPENLGNFGWLLADLGRYEDGIRHLSRAVAIAPGLTEWQKALARFTSETGRVRDAAEHAKILTELNPNDGQIWATRSMIETMTGYCKIEALKYANEAVKINPLGVNENMALAMVQSAYNNHAGAIAALSQIEDDDLDDVYHTRLGQSYILAGEPASAVNVLYQAVDYQTPAKRPKTLAVYGIALQAEGRKDEAAAAFQSAVNARHQDRIYSVEDQFAYALCEIGNGEVEAGKSTIEKLAVRYPETQGLFFEVLQLLNRMKDPVGSELASEIRDVLDNSGTGNSPLGSGGV